MNLTNKQIQTQNAILLAVHGTDDIDEAKEKDLASWCITEYNEWELAKVSYIFTVAWSIDNLYEARKKWLGVYIRHCWYSWDVSIDRIASIVWQPPTLSRVLTALGKNYHYWQWFIYHFVDVFNPDVVVSRDCRRQLLKEDGTDATLRDQTQETQNTIHDLLC